MPKRSIEEVKDIANITVHLFYKDMKGLSYMALIRQASEEYKKATKNPVQSVQSSCNGL